MVAEVGVAAVEDLGEQVNGSPTRSAGVGAPEAFVLQAIMDPLGRYASATRRRSRWWSWCRGRPESCGTVGSTWVFCAEAEEAADEAVSQLADAYRAAGMNLGSAITSPAQVEPAQGVSRYSP